MPGVSEKVPAPQNPGHSIGGANGPRGVNGKKRQLYRPQTVNNDLIQNFEKKQSAERAPYNNIMVNLNPPAAKVKAKNIVNQILDEENEKPEFQDNQNQNFVEKLH